MYTVMLLSTVVVTEKLLSRQDCRLPRQTVYHCMSVQQKQQSHPHYTDLSRLHVLASLLCLQSRFFIREVFLFLAASCAF